MEARAPVSTEVALSETSLSVTVIHAKSKGAVTDLAAKSVVAGSATGSLPS